VLTSSVDWNGIIVGYVGAPIQRLDPAFLLYTEDVRQVTQVTYVVEQVHVNKQTCDLIRIQPLSVSEFHRVRQKMFFAVFSAIAGYFKANFYQHRQLGHPKRT